jgi:hypothetical protein
LVHVHGPDPQWAAPRDCGQKRLPIEPKVGGRSR